MVAFLIFQTKAILKIQLTYYNTQIFHYKSLGLLKSIILKKYINIHIKKIRYIQYTESFLLKLLIIFNYFYKDIFVDLLAYH